MLGYYGLTASRQGANTFGKPVLINNLLISFAESHKGNLGKGIGQKRSYKSLQLSALIKYAAATTIH